MTFFLRSPLLSVLGSLLMALALAGPALAAPDDPAFATAARMGRGVNVLGYDGIWDGGTDAPFRLAEFAQIKAAGFGHVRINLFGFKYMDKANGISPDVLDDLDRVLDAAIAAGLVPVIDEHDNEICQNAEPGCAPKLLAFWTQISQRYAHRYPEAVFEILNEPGWKMTTGQWNALSARALKLIRSTNPDRTVIVAALNLDDRTTITALKLPEADRNLIVTVHYYKPFHFTHQGASWDPELAKLHDIDWGSDADKRQVVADLQQVADWAKIEGRPIYLGEFGAYEGAPAEARARWVSFVARTAEGFGWPWAYWQFDHDFALFNQDTQQWVAPILSALIPR